MKTFLWNIVMILYVIASMSILSYAIVFPLAMGAKGFPIWTAWIVYPLTIVICASQEQLFNYFNKINS